MAADARGSFWAYLKKMLPTDGHYTRIESSVSDGFPDVHYTLYGTSGTIELKVAHRPGAKNPFKGKCGLRKSQRAWIADELLADGKVILALQCGDRVYLLDASLYADDLYRMTEEDLSRVAAVQWQKGRHRVKAYPYEDIRGFLTS